MPSYDYKCKECGHEFIGISTIDGRRDVKCEKCNGETSLLLPKRVFVTYNCGGFAHQELAREAHDHMAAEAMAEGFQSHTEMEVSVEQAYDRAAKLGIPVERIVGEEVAKTGKVPSLEDGFEAVM